MMFPRFFSPVAVFVFAFAVLASALPAGQRPYSKFSQAVAYGSAGPYTDSVAVADLRGDGNLDLVVANYCKIARPDYCDDSGEVAVLLADGNGTFRAPVTYGTGAYFVNSVAVADMNGDGIPDLVATNFFKNANGSGHGAVSVLFGNGDGTFQPPVIYDSGEYSTYSVAIADLNGDGNPDLAVTNGSLGGDNNGTVSVLLNNGNGSFQPAVSYSSGGRVAASVAIGDLNGDKIADLVVANYGGVPGQYDGGSVGVLLGNGNGTFQPAVNYASGDLLPVSVALADLRGHGIQDVVVANKFSAQGKQARSAVDVLLGNGNGTFQTAFSYTPHGFELPSWPAVGPGIDSLAVADVNGDGIPDLAVVELCQNLQHYTDCVGDGQVNVMLGNGDGTFQPPIVYSSGGYIGSAMAIADVDGDGRPDLLVTSEQVNPNDYTGTVAVLLNQTSYPSRAKLTSSPNPSRVHRRVKFTATITPGVPDGEVVTFYAGTTKIGTGTTKKGMASLTTSFSQAKIYAIKASYPGDAFRKASSATVKQVVNP
jgi:hypothetical protein